MSVVRSDDFTAYANTAALAAVWTAEDGSGNYGAPIMTGGAAGATVTVPYGTAVWEPYHWRRLFTGLTPFGFYRVTAVVSTYTVPGDYYPAGAAISQSNFSGEQRDLVDSAGTGPTTLSTNLIQAGADGALLVNLGFFYGAGGYWHDDATITFTSMAIEDTATDPVFATSLPIRGADWDQIAYTAGVVTLNGSVIGVTRGGLRFDPGETWEPLPYDGDLVAPVGVHEMTGQKPRFIGSFLPVGPRQLALYLPKSTQTTDQDTTTVTPTIPGATLVTGDYSQNIAVTWPYLSGGTITVTFPYGFWQRYEFNPENKGEMLIPVEILAVPLTASTAPYYITVVEPGMIAPS